MKWANRSTWDRFEDEMNQYMENTSHLKTREISVLPQWGKQSFQRGGAGWQLHREMAAEPGPLDPVGTGRSPVPDDLRAFAASVAAERGVWRVFSPLQLLRTGVWFSSSRRGIVPWPLTIWCVLAAPS